MWSTVAKSFKFVKYLHAVVFVADGELFLTKLEPLPMQTTNGYNEHAIINVGQLATFRCKIAGAQTTPDLYWVHSNIANENTGEWSYSFYLWDKWVPPNDKL